MVVGRALEGHARVEEYRIGGAAPAHAERPDSVEGVVSAIRRANDDGQAVVLWGGGTRIEIGDDPARYDVALDLRSLAGVVDHEPHDLVITVRAGTTIAELERTLAAHGQWWPVEAGDPERATVGGTVAGAADGPSRLRYFHPRDWVIGVRAVLGDGTLTKAGGHVVKNATGYDLTKLYSGSHGSLCAIVELSLKLTACPERAVSLRAHLPTMADAMAQADALLATGIPLDALAIVRERGGPGAGTTSLFVRLAGTAGAVDRLRETVSGRLRVADVDGAEWARIAALPLRAPLSLRAAYRPARGFVPDLGGCDALHYPGVGISHLFPDSAGPGIGALRAALEARGGALVIERAPAEVRHELGSWGNARSSTAVAAALKARFDPRGVLAPGRMPG